jgi:hypothetical protein
MTKIAGSGFRSGFTSQRQCCGSGSGIGCLFDPWIRDGRNSASGSGIRDKQPGSYFLELRNHIFAFLGVKILKFFEDPGWKKVGSGINIPDPQHWAWIRGSGSTTLLLPTFILIFPLFIGRNNV